MYSLAIQARFYGDVECLILNPAARANSQVGKKVTSIFYQFYVLFLGSTIPVLRSLLVTVCEVLLQSTRELPSPQELKDSQDGQDKSFLNTDHRLKVCIELEFSSTNF